MSADLATTETPERATLFSVLNKSVGAGDLPYSNVHALEEEFAGNIDALPCPYPPESLVRLYERSNALRPCVEAMTVNVHAFGHRVVPRIDPTSADIDKRIASSITAERLWHGEEEPPEPLPEEIEERKRKVIRGIELEELRLKTFLDNCNEDGFIAFRMQLQADLEITGNAYMEVVRDAAGRIAQLNYCPSVGTRLRPLESDAVTTKRRVRISDISFDVVDKLERPRGFVQSVNARRTFFKAFGDQRVVSTTSGRAYATMAELPNGEKPATEMVHFNVFSLRTAYGVPRWIGAVYEVLGIEAMSHVNYLGFDNKGIPPLAISVSGGTLSGKSSELLKDYVNVRLKGRGNYHSILLLEALPTAGGGGSGSGDRTRIAIQPLAQPQDAVFLEYAERSEDVVARQWRISPITRGKTKDFNKATASAAMQKDEEQVFQPARRGFDDRFERTVLRDLGFKYVRMESNSPIASDPEALSRVLGLLVEKNVIIPNEARRVASNVLNTDLPEIEADWAKQPVALTIAGIPLQLPPSADDPTGEAARSRLAEVGTTLQRVLALRNLLQAQADARANEAQDAARFGEAEILEEEEVEVDGQKALVLRIPQSEMNKLVTPHGAGAGAPEMAAAA